MAGSYRYHLQNGFSLIENMGDAYEAIHEMFWLIESQIGLDKACLLLDEKYWPMHHGKIEKDKEFEKVERLMNI